MLLLHWAWPAPAAAMAAVQVLEPVGTVAALLGTAASFSALLANLLNPSAGLAGTAVSTRHDHCLIVALVGSVTAAISQGTRS